MQRLYTYCADIISYSDLFIVQYLKVSEKRFKILIMVFLFVFDNKRDLFYIW